MSINKYAVIFDVDGTLVDSSEHFHLLDSTPLGHTENLYEYHRRALNSPPRSSVVELSRVLWASGIKIIIVTSRYEKFRGETENWLSQNNIQYDNLYMRKNDDHREHRLIKRDILALLKIQGYKILLGIDDNPEIIKLWQDNNIVAAQVPVSSNMI